MKKTLLTFLALGSSAVFLPTPAQAQRSGVSIGIGINIGRQPNYGYGGSVYGGPQRYYTAPPRAPRIHKPRWPGRGYVWVPGYYAPVSRGWRWSDGYWAVPPRGARKWVQPRYRDNYFYSGYWR